MMRLAPPMLAVVLLAPAAFAAEEGGLAVTGPGLGPTASLPAPPAAAGPVFQTGPNLQATNPARARLANGPQSIGLIRGDGGFLAGFGHGQPLAASRQPPPPEAVTVVEAPVTVNNYQSPTITAVNSTVNLATGSDNVATQTVAAAPPAAGFSGLPARP